MKKIKIRATRKIIYLYAFVLALVFAFSLVLARTNVVKGIDDDSLDIFFTVVTQYIIFFLFPLIIFKIIFRKKERLISFILADQKMSKKIFIVVVLFSLVAIQVSAGFNSIFLTLLEKIGFHFPPSKPKEVNTAILFRDIFFVAITPAICEEFIHRGILLNGLRKEYRAGQAVFLSALAFSLMHSNVPQTMHTFVLGIAIAFVVISTNNFYAGCIIHFINNFYATLMSFFNEKYSFITHYTEFLSTPNGIVFSIILRILLILMFFYTYSVLSKMYKKNEDNVQYNFDYDSYKILKKKRRENMMGFFVLFSFLIFMNIYSCLRYLQ